MLLQALLCACCMGQAHKGQQQLVCCVSMDLKHGAVIFLLPVPQMLPLQAQGRAFTGLYLYLNLYLYRQMLPLQAQGRAKNVSIPAGARQLQCF